MALSLAAATLGSALIGGGAAVYGASQQKDAASDARNADLAAQAQARADAQAAQQTVTNLQTPYLEGGNAAFSSLLNQYGLNSGQGGPGAQDWTNYVESSPDLNAAWDDPNTQAAWGGNEAAWGQAHYGSSGQAEGRIVPTYGGVQSSGSPNPNIFAPLPAFNPPGNYGTAPSMATWGAGPGAADLSEGAFKNSPLYNLGLAEGQSNLNSNFGAKGLLRSGAAIKGALDFARENVKNNYSAFASTAIQNQQLAQQGYNADRNAGMNAYTQSRNAFENDRNFGYGQYQDELSYLNAERDYQTGRYDVNRNYDTNRYDTNTNNLFRLAGSGQQAAANIGNAATNVADRTGNLALQGAQTQGQYADAVGNANAGLVGSLAGIGQNLFSNYTGRSQPLQPIAPPVSPYGYGNNVYQPVSPYNPGALTTMPQVLF